MTQAGEIMYSNFIELVMQNHDCPLCETEFKTPKHQQEFLDKVINQYRICL